MTKIVEIGSRDGRLCGELAAALSRRETQQDDSGRSGAMGAEFSHNSQVAFEAAESALKSFGLLALAPRDDISGETSSYIYALTMCADDMPNALAFIVADGDERLPSLLEAFVCVFCEYDHLSDRRDPFTPPPCLSSSMAMLARAGYAERLGEEFRWTALIGRTMRAAGLWDENFLSIREAEEKALDAEAQLAWRTMPDTLRRSILSGTVGVIQMTKILTLAWREGRWRPYRLDDRVELHGEFLLAKRLFELAEGRE